MKNSKVTRIVGLWIMLLGVLLIMFTGIGFRPDTNLLEAGTAEIGAASQGLLLPRIGALIIFLGTILVFIGYQPSITPSRVKK